VGLRPDAGGGTRALRGNRRAPRRVFPAAAVSRAAAERLLAVTAPFDRPVDTFLQMAWISGVTLLAATPTPIRDVSGETGGTTVQRRRVGLITRLRHEAMRPIYRARVLALYRRHLARTGAIKG
jgi:GR25 family glycosyltransferase involved in LPS biosynthesis